MKYKNVTATILAVLALVSVTMPITVLAAGPSPINLLSTSNFAILSKTGITNTGSHSSAITGNIGASPITAAAMNTVFCSEITGKIYGVNAAYVGSGNQTCFLGNPPASNKTFVDKAVLDMGTVYADAAGRTLPTATELGAGNIGGKTLAPGLYKWSTGVTIPTNVTLSGGPNDVWIFQIAGNLSIASGGSVPTGIKVILAGGAQATNIFWQVAGLTGATLGTYSTFNGTILSAKQVIIQTGAVLHGRALAQTQVTLDHNSIILPTSTTPALGRISGTSYEDLDGNGMLRDGNNHRLSGWRIYLDSNNNSVLDTGERSTMTDSNGNYSFSNLPVGNYEIREVGQAGWTPTFPSAKAYSVSLSAGMIVINDNFGNFKLGTVSGMMFNDANDNHQKDSTEVGLPGWTIRLSKVGSVKVLASSVTDSHGNYRFGNLGPGLYSVREVAQTGWTQTTNNPSDITVISSTASVNDNFGNHHGQ